MSGRLISARLAPLARRAVLNTPRQLSHYSTTGAGGLLRSDAGLRLLKKRPWPLGSYALHNVPAVRSISFVRILPKIVTKFASLGAVAGGAVIAGLSYVQYQAGRQLNSNVIFKWVNCPTNNTVQRPEPMLWTFSTVRLIKHPQLPEPCMEVPPTS